jgi:hypothetical protein
MIWMQRSNHSFQWHRSACCFCSKSAAKYPHGCGIVSPPESDRIAVAERPHPLFRRY